MGLGPPSHLIMRACMCVFLSSVPHQRPGSAPLRGDKALQEARGEVNPITVGWPGRVWKEARAVGVSGRWGCGWPQGAAGGVVGGKMH